MSNVTKPGIKSRQFIKRIAKLLQDNDIRKTIVYPKRTFYITDDDGNCKTFTVKTSSKEVLYTMEDIEKICDAMWTVIIDCIRRGETIYAHNKFMISTHYRQPRISKVPGSDEIYHVPGSYAPKFTFGTEARLAAKSYDGSELPSSNEYNIDDYDLGDDAEFLSDDVFEED